MEQNGRRGALCPVAEGEKHESRSMRGSKPGSLGPGVFRVVAFGSGRQGSLSDSVYFRVKFSPDRFAISRRIVPWTIHSLRGRPCRNSLNDHPRNARSTSSVSGRRVFDPLWSEIGKAPRISAKIGKMNVCVSVLWFTFVLVSLVAVLRSFSEHAWG